MILQFSSPTLCSSSATRVNWCSGSKLAPTSSLPSSEVNGEASSSVDVELCSYWRESGRMGTLDGIPRFPHLTSIAKCVLSLPVSNADTERVFSNVRKNCDRLSTEMEHTMCTNYRANWTSSTVIPFYWEVDRYAVGMSFVRRSDFLPALLVANIREHTGSRETEPWIDRVSALAH